MRAKDSTALYRLFPSPPTPLPPPSTFFTETAPWKKAAAAKKAAMATGTTKSTRAPTRAPKTAAVAEAEAGETNIAGKIGKASFLTLPWVYMAGEFISKQM